MKKSILTLSLTALFFSCGQKDKKSTADEKPVNDTTIKTAPVTYCSGEGLSLIEGGSEGIMGGKAIDSYLIINNSSTTCTLNGYPIVELLNKAKNPTTGVTTSNLSSADTTLQDAPPVVTLGPNDTAFFQLRYYNGEFTDPKPKVQETAYIKVKAPNSTREFILASKITAYGDVGISYIQKGLPQ